MSAKQITLLLLLVASLILCQTVECKNEISLDVDLENSCNLPRWTILNTLPRISYSFSCLMINSSANIYFAIESETVNLYILYESQYDNYLIDNAQDNSTLPQDYIAIGTGAAADWVGLTGVANETLRVLLKQRPNIVGDGHVKLYVYFNELPPMPKPPVTTSSSLNGHMELAIIVGSSVGGAVCLCLIFSGLILGIVVLLVKGKKNKYQNIQ